MELHGIANLAERIAADVPEVSSTQDFQMLTALRTLTDSNTDIVLSAKRTKVLPGMIISEKKQDHKWHEQI